MIIKSHVRGGYRSAAKYLKEIGQNEKTRLVEISDPDSANLDEAFHNMWVVGSCSRATKPLHHISINPLKDEHLTDKQVMKIVERVEQKYGYRPGDHQRVIVEHVLNSRQHFHVVWCRVSLTTGKAVWPGEHWKKSKQAAREMEVELGLKCFAPRRVEPIQMSASGRRGGGVVGKFHGLMQPIKIASPSKTSIKRANAAAEKSRQPIKPVTFPKGWPDAAIIAWESWGKHDPVRFFLLWSELASPGFVPD